MFKKALEIYEKHKQIILYLIFGGFTTLINYAVFTPLEFFTPLPSWLSTTIAWVASVTFAYITNRIIVFKSENTSRESILKEFLLFISARLLSGLITIGAMFLFVDILSFNSILIFTICNIFVIVFNYVASKWVIFSKDKGKKV